MDFSRQQTYDEEEEANHELAMQLADLNWQMEILISMSLGLGQVETIFCTFYGMYGHEIRECPSRGEFSEYDERQTRASNSYNLSSWPMHGPCGNFYNSGSSYEPYDNSYNPDWRNYQDFSWNYNEINTYE